MQLQNWTHTAKETLLDPGFGFAASGTLIFATTSSLGLAGCLTTALAIGAIKCLNVTNPSFMQKDNKFTRIVKDDRTPLRMLGLAELTVMGAVLAQNSVGLWAAASSIKDFLLSKAAWMTTFLPALASTAWAIADMEYAADISASQKAQRDTAKGIITPPKKKTFGQLLLSRPETLLIIGTLAMGLTAGGWSLLCLPLAVSGYAVALKNMIQKRDSYKGHPNMHFAGMMAISTAVGFAAANLLLGLGFLVSTLTFMRIEALTTPGGFKQILKDMKQGAENLLQKMTVLKVKKIPLKKLTSVSVPEPATASSMLAANTLKRSFVGTQEITPSATANAKPRSTTVNDMKI